MATQNNIEPDVELKDVGHVEARFLTRRAKEWAICHHISNQLVTNQDSAITDKKSDSVDVVEDYCHRFGRTDLDGLIGRIESSGLTIRRDPRLCSRENLRWLNTY